METKRKDKQAAEYIRRLAYMGNLEPRLKVSYSEPKSTESEECSLLMVKKYLRNVCKASASIIPEGR